MPLHPFSQQHLTSPYTDLGASRAKHGTIIGALSSSQPDIVSFGRSGWAVVYDLSFFVIKLLLII